MLNRWRMLCVVAVGVCAVGCGQNGPPSTDKSSTNQPATQPAALAPEKQLVQLSKNMMRVRLRSEVLVRQRMLGERERMPAPDDRDRVLENTKPPADLLLVRVATAKLLDWADQQTVRSRLAELATSGDPFVKLSATQVLAIEGMQLNEEFLRGLASGEKVYSSSEFECTEAAWALLAMGKTLPAAVNNHSKYVAPVLEEIRAAQQAGRDVSPTALAELADTLAQEADQVFLLESASKLTQAVGGQWRLTSMPPEGGLTLSGEFTKPQPGSVHTTYVIYVAPWTVSSSVRWHSVLASVAYRAIASNDRCTLMLTGDDDTAISNKIITVLGLRRLPSEESTLPATQPVTRHAETVPASGPSPVVDPTGATAAW